MESLRQVKVQKFEEFVDQRLKPDLVRAIAERQIEEFTQLIASIKAQIKLVCEGIRDLLQLIPAEKSLPERIF